MAAQREYTLRINGIEESAKQVSILDGGLKNVDGSIKQLTISVNGVDRSFSSAREALRTLTNERNTLKLMGKDVGELDNVVKKLQSDINDMSRSSAAMDNMLDSMQGLLALASTSKGLSSLFGVDDGEIQATIQKLVALQSVIQGIETIRKQMQTQEGIGMILSRGNQYVDKLAASLLGVKVQANGATLAVRALSTALKTIGIGILTTVIAYAWEALETWISAESEAEKAQRQLNEVMNEGAKAYTKAVGEITTYKTKVDSFNGSKEQEKKLVDELNSKLGKQIGQYKTIKEWKDALVDKSDAYITSLVKQAEAQAILNKYTEAYLILQQVQSNLGKGEYSSWWKFWETNAEADARELAKAQGEVDKWLEEYKKSMKELEEHNKNNNLFEFAPTIEKGSKTLKKGGQDLQKQVKDIEYNIAKTRIDAMKEGLTKTLAQLSLERNKRIEEAKKSGIMVGEQIKAINDLYARKELDAKIKHHRDLINQEQRYLDEYKRLQDDIYSVSYENSKRMNSLNFESGKDSAIYNVEQVSGSTETIKQLSEEVKKAITDYNKVFYDGFDKVIERYKELVVVHSQFSDELANASEIAAEVGRDIYEVEDEIVEKYRKSNEEYVRLLEMHPNIENYVNEEVYDILQLSLAKRMSAREEYNNRIVELTKQYADKELEIEKDKLDKQLKENQDNEEKRHRDLVGFVNNSKATLDAFAEYNKKFEDGSLLGMTDSDVSKYFDHYRDAFNEWLEDLEVGFQQGNVMAEDYLAVYDSEFVQAYLKQADDYRSYLEVYNMMTKERQEEESDNLRKHQDEMNMAFVSFLDKVRQEQETHNNLMTVYEKNYNSQIEQLEREKLEKVRRTNAEANNNMINEYDRAISAIRDKIDSAESSNAWGIINYGKTRSNLIDLRESVYQTMDSILRKKEEITRQFNDEEITFADFDAEMDNLNVLEKQARDTSQQIQRDLKELGTNFLGSINQWIQAAGQAMVSIMSSLSEIQQNNYQRQIDQLKAHIDEYEECLQRQTEITREHADEVNSIEDELRTARGDRRDALIDKLNAEMAAQRESLKQEKKIEAQKKKEEEKQKKLEVEAARKKKKMQEAQAYINMAMAISMAAVNSWPIPALPMIALATATGAAQIAAIKSQNIPSYGDGGVLVGRKDGGVVQGARHSQGGVKVLGGKAEIEGGEMIVNRRTTSDNIDLLYYINSKKHRLSLDEMIDFYSSNKSIRKNVMKPTMKFAEGGVLPQVNNEYNVSNQLVEAMIALSERPIVASIVEIENKMDNLRSIRTLAGINSD